jgi:hypothetical protein
MRTIEYPQHQQLLSSHVPFQFIALVPASIGALQVMTIGDLNGCLG